MPNVRGVWGIDIGQCALKALKLRPADGGRVVWVLIPERGEKGRQLRVRRVADGKLSAEAVVALPDRFAGNAVAVADTVAVFTIGSAPA